MKRTTSLAVLILTAVSACVLPAWSEGFSTAVFRAYEPLEFTVPEANPPYKVPQYLIPAAGLSGEQLFQFLHKATVYSSLGTGTDYLRAKKYMFSVSDNSECGGGRGVTCLYSRICVRGSSEHGQDYVERGDLNGDGVEDVGGMNAEHAWPQGFFNKALPMKSDLHHVFPTFVTPNNVRGSDPFGIVLSHPVYSTASGTKLGSEGYEPADAAKGDVARAILYFVVRYYDRDIRDGMNYKDFWIRRVQMFLDWSEQDPPDAFEKRRNDLIEKFQGNRNPFVDDPTLANRVGLKVFQSH